MSPVLRTLIFTIFVPGFWTVAMPYWLIPRDTRPSLYGVGAVGGVLIAAGIALYIACAFWGFALRGRGTPLPLDPPKKLVVEGPYRVVRNPMYWSVALVMLGPEVHEVGADEAGGACDEHSTHCRLCRSSCL